MSRKVDPNSKSLSQEDKIYLIQRGRLPDSVLSVEEQRKLVDGSTPAAATDRANTGDANTANLSVEQLEELLEKKRAEAEGVDPKSLFGSSAGPAPDEDEDEEDEEVVAPYDQYTKATLIAEIQRRNEGRDDADKLKLSGNVAELVERLTEDDEDEE